MVYFLSNLNKLHDIRCNAFFMDFPLTDLMNKKFHKMSSIENGPSTANQKVNADSTDVKPVEQSILQKSLYASEVWRRQYLNGRTADAYFTFDNSDARIPAHKSVLSAASAVFDSMFYGPMAVNGDVPLPGKSPEAFKDFLQFCYLDEVELKPNSITDVMSLLHEYQMSDGLMLCGRFLADNWTIGDIDDICSFYDWAINLQMDEFQAFSERQIGKYSGKIFKSDGFLSCSFAVIARILELDVLLSEESDILGACLAWARHKCQQNGQDASDMQNVRDYLTDRSTGENLLWKIRYGSIEHDKF